MRQLAFRGRFDISDVRRVANNPVRDHGYTRTYYSYPAKFQAQLPNALIQMLSEEGDLILDPWCGGGTTGLESLILRRTSVNYDINPFAILISRVKTTKLDTTRLSRHLERVLSLRGSIEVDVLDEGDKECLGPYVSREINHVVTNIMRLKAARPYKDFFRLAVIHTIKLIGRRDSKTIENGDDDNGLLLFEAKVIRPQHLFIESLRRKLNNMIGQMATLPEAAYPIEFYCESNHNMHHVEDERVDLVITSPPYKDVDVEYALIQIQRPSLRRSKRSEVISRILGVRPPEKSALCGFRGEGYWRNLAPSLAECRRVTKPGAYVFFWTGFKNSEDRWQFEDICSRHSLQPVETIRVTLSKDRVASSRSTHHGRETGMLQSDFLFVCRRAE